VQRFTADSANLPGVGKIQVAVQFRTGPDLTDLDAAMALIGCRVLRGEKTPVSDRRCLHEVWADCL
jgi:hypothetical protein